MTAAALCLCTLSASACLESPYPDRWDHDGDGHANIDDCEPWDAEVHPGTYEDCTDGVDNDCNGATDGWDHTCGQLSSTAGWIEVSAGGYASCALWEDGEASCWGLYDVTVAPEGPFEQISAGGYHVCGLTSEGEVLCWGWENGGRIEAPQGNFVELEAGTTASCAITASGEISCWGGGLEGPPAGTGYHGLAYAEHGCVLDVSGLATCWDCIESNPACEPPATELTQVAIGQQHTCGLERASGAMTCWGRLPEGLYGYEDERFVQIAVSSDDFQTCGLREDGSLRCFGGEALLEGTLLDTLAPTGSFQQLSVGDYHACALTDEGATSGEGFVRCWGNGQYGQLAAP